MGNARPSKKASAIEWLQSRGAERVDEGLAAELGAAFPETSAKTLREALIESGLPLAPLVEGVRQDSMEELERSLLALAGEYETGGTGRRLEVRQRVITARQHAEWASRSRRAGQARRESKAEVLLWIRTWLENPPLFGAWAALRKRACHRGPDAM
ncbi:MAG: hypothetical protein HY858_06540 [Candidatus Solibacter usitatus]|nr:hypothetical protein [Candidatus Solibacter usitatus]